MAQTPHIGNSQSAVMRKYKIIASLKNINQASDRLEINYGVLDSESVGELKQTIANVLKGFDDMKEISEEKKKYIETLKKQNMGYKVDIDYSKLDENNEDLLLAYTLKTSIQKTLTERKAIIYRDMTLNANY